MDRQVTLSVEVPQPVTLADACVTADDVVLIGHPNNHNDVERSGSVVEKL